MAQSYQCPQCGAEVPGDAPQGLCPNCVLKAGFGTQPTDNVSQAGSGSVSASSSDAQFVPPTPAELAPHFPELEVLGLVGRGGMGVVYKARQKRLDRFVALKILSPKIGQDPAFAARFQREARAMAMLNHPHVVAVYDFGQTTAPLGPREGSGTKVAESEGGASSPSPVIERGVEGESSLPSPTGRGAGGEGSLYFFLMEFVDGVNVRQLLDTGKLAPEEALAIVPQICEALQYAHDHGVVHHDIKPENVLLDKEGRVKIADFGIAKLVGREAKDQTLTGAGQIVGTPQYMAPEQIEHPLQVDHRADIYSLGVVFYQMLTGELPIGRFAPPSKKVHVDVRLDEVVLRTLEKEPELRYQQASEIKSRVETIVTTPSQWGATDAESVQRRKAKQAAANLPLFVERAGRRHVYWPGVLCFCGTIGLWVLGANLAIALAIWLLTAQTWPMFQPFELPWVFMLMAACAIMRMAALKLGSSEAVQAGSSPFTKASGPRRIISAILLMAGGAVIAAVAGAGTAFFVSWMRTASTTALADGNNIARIAVSIVLLLAVGLFIFHRLWRSGSERPMILRDRRHPLLIASALVVVAAILFLAFCPAALEIQGKGTLEPVNRKDICAGIEGQIHEFGTDIHGKPIEHGSWVKKGQLLLKLRNPALNAEKAEIDGQLIIDGQHVRDIQHELSTSGPTIKRTDREQLERQLTEAERKLKSLQAQAEIVNARMADLELYSPIDGQIVTWDLNNRLEGRPVQQGQALLRVANPNGDWELDLHMPEDCMDCIVRAKRLADERNEQLPVEYIMATEPATVLKGTVKEIKNSAAVLEKDDGNVVVIKVAVSKQDINRANPREGTTVTAKVHCGRRSLGYVWFRDLIGFFPVRVNSSTENSSGNQAAKTAVNPQEIKSSDSAAKLIPGNGMIEPPRAQSPPVAKKEDVLTARRDRDAVAASRLTNIQPLDILEIRAINMPPDQPVDGYYLVEPDGNVALGPLYGRANVDGLTMEQAEEKITQQLKRTLRDPAVQVTLAIRPAKWRRAVFPKLPFTINPYDLLRVHVIGALPDQPIDNFYLVEAAGTIPLGPTYGRVQVSGLSLEAAERAVQTKLEQVFSKPSVQVTLPVDSPDSPGMHWQEVAMPKTPYTIQPGDLLFIDAIGTEPEQPIQGVELVEPTGTVPLGPPYGRVKLDGLTLEGAEQAIKEKLREFLRQPEVSVALAGWTGQGLALTPGPSRANQTPPSIPPRGRVWTQVKTGEAGAVATLGDTTKTISGSGTALGPDE
ncbi:MAG: protein kinase domain-containing protein, partial [Thermoguttaceae bacterium]